MTKIAAKKLNFQSEIEDLSLMAAYRLKVTDNQKLQEEIVRLRIELNELSGRLIDAEDEANKYKEMYLALRQGHYLLIPNPSPQ
ncbi:hypothetical protein [Cohnella luojiensis]|uniref:Uncharacterized protein n=1 Tax=Cohnella luojiensis TaxID=652876 RepID=A0A4Y8LPK2_9BACL|nr:hypothetical protein [Cohnella luojiensis]TFE23062.1 hypothetical protein E2980_20120 [Cohnella luojiensis]